MQKILISIPDQLAARMRAAIPSRQRSKRIATLIEKEVITREKQLYQSALALEQDEALHREMADWDLTVEDGLDNESW